MDSMSCPLETLDTIPFRTNMGSSGNVQTDEELKFKFHHHSPQFSLRHYLERGTCKLPQKMIADCIPVQVARNKESS
jgi:hypothetical protein